MTKINKKRPGLAHLKKCFIKRFAIACFKKLESATSFKVQKSFLCPFNLLN